MTKALLMSRILDGLIYLIDGNITKQEAIDGFEKLIDEYTDNLHERMVMQKIAEEYKLLNATYKLALTAIAKDKDLKCECGNHPYVDGEPCPKCTAIKALEIVSNFTV